MRPSSDQHKAVFICSLLCVWYIDISCGPNCNRLQCSTVWWFVPILQSFTVFNSMMICANIAIVYSVQQYDDLCQYCIS